MNTHKDEVRYVGTNWEPEVNAHRRGKAHTPTRKVVTKGIKKIDCTRLFNEINDILREGYEVRLTWGSEDSIRVFHLVSKDGTRMYPSVESMGIWRKNALNGLRAEKGTVRGIRCDNANEISEALMEIDAKCMKERHSVICISPDKVIKCPKCGTNIRVGKYLASSK